MGGTGGHGAGELVGTSGAGTGGVGGAGGNGSWGFDNSQLKFQYTSLAGGGGIASLGALTMTASTISGNNTGVGGMGGASGDPGQQANGSFRSAGPGGDGGSAGIGGGLLFTGNTATAQLTNVTIAGNFTGDARGRRRLQRSHRTGRWQGRLRRLRRRHRASGNTPGNAVVLKQVTISQNGLGSAGAGGAFSGTPTPGLRGQGAAVATGGRTNPAAGAAGVLFQNTLVANNGVAGTDLNCIQYYPANQYVDLYDFHNNLSYPDNSCPGNVGNPMLGPLQNNGGPTFTMLPAAGSSAIGGVPSASCTVHVDQRGNARPGGTSSSCDIGAVETGLAAPLPQLSILKSGTGAGTVTSSPTGIACGATCAATSRGPMTLTATPAAGSTFSGWSGAGAADGPMRRDAQCRHAGHRNLHAQLDFVRWWRRPPAAGAPQRRAPEVRERRLRSTILAWYSPICSGGMK